MPINIPTLSQIITDIISDLQSKLGITIPLFGKNFLRTWAGVQGAKLKLFYLTIASVQKNIFPDTADSELNGGTLERFGRVKLNRNPFPATASIYDVQVTGEIGAVIQASTTWKSNDDSINPGEMFIIDNEYTLVAETDTIQVRSINTGLSTRLAVGDKITATAPIILVNKTATVTVENTIPQDAESIEDYRNKVILAYQLEAQGGAGGDYILWSFDAQGVEMVYPYAKSGQSAIIDLFVEATIADSTDGKGTPTQAILTAVESVVEMDPDITKPDYERGRRPLGAFEINYLPVIVRNVNISILGFIGLTPEIEATVNSALFDYMQTVRPYIASAIPLDKKNDILSITKLSFVIISAIPDNTLFNTLTLKVDGVQSNQFQFTYGDIPYLNLVSFV